MTEATACRDEDVFIVGGANSAGQAAVYLSGFARRVTMLVRGSGLSATMSSYLIDQLKTLPNVVVRPRTQVVEVHGGAHLESITVRDEAQGTTETLPAAALLVFIGATPRTEWLADVVARDAAGLVLTGPDVQRGDRAATWPERRDPFPLETSVPGIVAAGDVRHGSIKRVASSVGEGAMAVSFVHQSLATR
jgi:thioredoxin reductase (NADPH)